MKRLERAPDGLSAGRDRAVEGGTSVRPRRRSRSCSRKLARARRLRSRTRSRRSIRAPAGRRRPQLSRPDDSREGVRGAEPHAGSSRRTGTASASSTCRRSSPAYKPRPLAGIWATAPFLHNGSVPTMYDLLSPVSERPKTFRVGSREYDPQKLGLKQPSRWLLGARHVEGRESQHRPRVQRRLQAVEGRRPAAGGLIGPLLSPRRSRYAIIEHLKVRNDDVDGPQEPHVPTPPSCQPPPPRPDAAKRIVR